MEKYPLVRIKTKKWVVKVCFLKLQRVKMLNRFNKGLEKHFSFKIDYLKIKISFGYMTFSISNRPKISGFMIGKNGSVCAVRTFCLTSLCERHVLLILSLWETLQNISHNLVSIRHQVLVWFNHHQSRGLWKGIFLLIPTM